MSNRFPNRYFPKIDVGCPWIVSDFLKIICANAQPKAELQEITSFTVHVMSEWSTLPCSEEVNPGHLGNNIPFFVKYYLVKQ